MSAGDPRLWHGGHGRAKTDFPVVAARGAWQCHGVVHSADAVGARAHFSSGHPGREPQPPLPCRAEANSPTMPGIVSLYMKPLFVVCRLNVIYVECPAGSDDSHSPVQPRSPGCDFVKGKRLRNESSQQVGDLRRGSWELQQSVLCVPPWLSLGVTVRLPYGSVLNPKSGPFPGCDRLLDFISQL